MSPQRNPDGSLPGVKFAPDSTTEPPIGSGYNVDSSGVITITGTGNHHITMVTVGSNIFSLDGWSWTKDGGSVVTSQMPTDGYVVGPIMMGGTVPLSGTASNTVTFFGNGGSIIFSATTGSVGVFASEDGGFVALTGTNRPPPGGVVNLLYPNVDMHFQRMATAFNGTLHPNSGIPESTAVNDWLYLLIGELSAQEHTILNQFFNLKDTASTINLLHDTQVQAPPGGVVNLLYPNGYAFPTNGHRIQWHPAPKFRDSGRAQRSMTGSYLLIGELSAQEPHDIKSILQPQGHRFGRSICCMTRRFRANR